MKKLPALVAFAAVLFVGPAVIEAQPLPRTVLALYSSTDETDITFLPAHDLAEMPLNHLGLIVRFHDVTTGLPDLDQMGDVRAILTWFGPDSVPEARSYIAWALDAIESGRKLVVVGSLGIESGPGETPTSVVELNRLWNAIGLETNGDYHEITYDWEIAQESSDVVGFERPMEGIRPAFSGVFASGSQTEVLLSLRRGRTSRRPEREVVLVATTASGGYIAGNYAVFQVPGRELRQWIVDPFEFFRRAFETDDLPKPDATTLNGRRIFYSHIDGDGWRNLSQISEYRKQRASSAEVVYRELLTRFPDLPVTVAPIAADIDPDWEGTGNDTALARRILALPHIEAGTHTYSHPLDWNALAPAGGRGETMGRAVSESPVSDEYEQSRSYMREPFDLRKEIEGSVDFINALLPAGKKVRVVQWSGNTLPFEEAIMAADRLGLQNINGGDARYDSEYASYSWISPLGREVGNTWQVYASNSNENTYTGLWSERYFGFRFLTDTIRNTGSPVRVKPHNVYYHMYSGERMASLEAVQSHYEEARRAEVVPITTSHYAAIVRGFFGATIAASGPDRWTISNRGRLDTIRFDRASLRRVDFLNSSGVIGARHHQGSLYVALDAARPTAVIALIPGDGSSNAEAAQRVPYLVESRWVVSNVEVWPTPEEKLDVVAAADRAHLAMLSFEAAGFGPGEVVWRFPRTGLFVARITNPDGSQWEQLVGVGDDRLGRLNLGTDRHGRGFTVEVRPAEARIGRSVSR